MAINKDFVVKNGLEVNRLLIRTNTGNNRVGINTDVINSTLDVNGQISAKSLSISGVTTFSTINVSSSLQLNGSSGSNGQYLKSTGTGVTWSNFPSTRTTSTIAAVLGQTLFGFNYNIGFLDVFINGTKLSSTDFLAVDGNNIILSTPCFGGETVEFISYSAETIGITTTLIIGIGGITIQEEGSVVGLSSGVSTLNFVGSSVTAIASGIGATIYISPNSSQWVTAAAGIHTLSNVGIGTTNPTSALTVKGNTSLETLNVTGVSTFGGNINVSDKNILFGLSAGSSDDRIVWGASSAEIYTNTTNLFLKTNLTSLNLQGEIISLSNYAGDEVLINASNGGSVDLYYNNSKKLETTGTGITVTGTIFTNQLNVSGLSTTSSLNVGTGGTIITTTTAGLVGIGTTNPTSKLTVSGDALINGLTVGLGGSAVTSNTAIGSSALYSNTTGVQNTANGGRALYFNTTGDGNTSTGYQSFYYNTTGSNNTGIGISAGLDITTGSKNTLLGSYTGNQNGLDIRTSNNNVVLSDGDGNIRFYANSSGNVGLGTTNPTSKLTVSGDVLVSGAVTASSFSGSGSGLTNLPASSISWSISATGSTDYVFSGPGIVAGNTNDPVLYLYKGFTYTFVNTTGGTHPFAIRDSNGGSDYTPGVSGSQTGTQTFVVPMNAPSTLYYQCTAHPGMGNTINIV